MKQESNLSQYNDVNIMWQESSEWTKLGGNAFRCLLESGIL